MEGTTGETVRYCPACGVSVTAFESPRFCAACGQGFHQQKEQLKTIESVEGTPPQPTTALAPGAPPTNSSGLPRVWPWWLAFLLALSASESMTASMNRGEHISPGLWIFVDLFVLGSAAWLIRLYLKRWRLKRAGRGEPRT